MHSAIGRRAYVGHNGSLNREHKFLIFLARRSPITLR